MRMLVGCLGAVLYATIVMAADDTARFAQAHENGRVFDRTAASIQRVLKAWLSHADEKTLLLPDRVPGPGQGAQPGDTSRLYSPHNSAADLYPYLILTAHLTDPDLYRGRLLEMLRNEVSGFTSAQKRERRCSASGYGIEASPDAKTGRDGE